MYYIYCVLALLSYFSYALMRELAEKNNDLPPILSSLSFNAWFAVTGLAFPFFTILYYEKWYMAILYFAISYFFVMPLLAIAVNSTYNSLMPKPEFSFFHNRPRIDFRLPTAISIISIIFFLIILFS